MVPLFLRITTAGALYLYGSKSDALAAAGGSDRILELVNPGAVQQLGTVSGGVITLSSYDGSKRHVQVVK